MAQVLALAMALWGAAPQISAASTSLAPAHRAEGEGWCYPSARVTGYVRTAHGSHTYDGTPITTPEAIAAASWDIPLGWYADVNGAGVYRIADRGSGLGSAGWVDIAVWSYEEAYALTSRRLVCVRPPDETL